MICATRAIVAKGTYGPNRLRRCYSSTRRCRSSMRDEMANEVRTQISKGADVVKVYADYRWGINGEASQPLLLKKLPKQ